MKTFAIGTYQKVRYIRNGSGGLLQQCEEKIESFEESIKDHESQLEEIRASVSKFEKEIAESDTFLSKLRDNERIRSLRKEMKETQEKIDAFDIEEAAKARRQFDTKYTAERKREGEMEAEVAKSNDFDRYDCVL